MSKHKFIFFHSYLKKVTLENNFQCYVYYSVYNFLFEKRKRQISLKGEMNKEITGQIFMGIFAITFASLLVDLLQYSNLMSLKEEVKILISSTGFNVLRYTNLAIDGIHYQLRLAFHDIFCIFF